VCADYRGRLTGFKKLGVADQLSGKTRKVRGRRSRHHESWIEAIAAALKLAGSAIAA
jgi:hypothetical protein